MAKETHQQISNGSIVRWIGIVVAISLTVAGWVYTLGVNGERLKANLIADATVHPKIVENRESIIAIQKDIDNIQQDMTRQAAVQQQILDKQDQILRIVQTSP